MAIFCIPRHLAEKLKESALKGEVDIKKLYEMSSPDRNAFFAKHTNGELGSLINTKFEQAMVSKQKTALTDWATSVFSPKMRKKPAYQGIVDKINSLEEMGVLSQKSEKAFLQDLVSDKLGLSVSPKEIGEINELAKKIDIAQKNMGDELGNPTKLDENLAFFEAKAEMDKYLRDKNPASRLQVLTGTIGRGMMLFSVKSPVLNIGSNIEVGFTEALSRRISQFQIKGADNQLAKDFVKMANKIYQKTGYDISRMTSLKDVGLKGERVLDQTIHAEGPGAIRAVGRVVEDVVFKQLMGAPDVVFGSAHFADSVNLNAMKLARGDKALAREIMLDAMRLEPKTAKGEIIRAQGVLDAQVATWTDKSWASKLSLGVRKIFNDISGDYRVGDYLFPFVKTPANVISTGMDYAGLGIPKALIKTVKAFKNGDLKSKEYISGMTRDLTRSGLGITAAIILSSYVDEDSYVGAYDPARAQFEQLRGSNTNSFKIGDRWVSVDWLGPVSVPFSAIMYAKKYGGSGWEKTFQYGKGVLEQIKRLPGVEDILEQGKKAVYKKDKSLEEMTGEAGDYAIGEIASRLMPSFISDIAKAIDPFDRQSSTAVEAFKKKIPGLRQTLPVKTDIMGEEVEAEPWWSSILFGARVKTAKGNELTDEIYNLMKNEDKSVNFTNWDKTSGKKLSQMKSVLGQEKYDELKIEYGKILKDALIKFTENPKYETLSDSEKLDKINSLDSKIIDKLMKENDFKYNPNWTPPTKWEEKGMTQEEYVKTREFKDLASDYWDAFNKDPQNAWKALVTKEKLDVVKGDLVELQRFFGNEWNEEGGSQEYKELLMRRKGIPLSESGDWKLEHIIPRTVGGGNEDSNLYLETTELHDSYTRLEVATGIAVMDGKITRKEAEKWFTDLKMNKTLSIKDLEKKLKNL